eukprot:g28324.t1
MVYAGAGVCAVIGTLSPVCTAVISSCCGRRLTVLSWGGVIIAFLGALVISWGEVSSVEGESKNKSQIIQGLIYAFASLSGRCAKISRREAWNQLTPELGGYIALSCSFALALNFLGTFALHELGASAQQIVGKLNTICLASISVAFLGEHLPVVVVVGSALVLGGVAIFERGQHDVGHEDDSDTESDLEESLEPIKPLRGQAIRKNSPPLHENWPPAPCDAWNMQARQRPSSAPGSKSVRHRRRSSAERPEAEDARDTDNVNHLLTVQGSPKKVKFVEETRPSRSMNR